MPPPLEPIVFELLSTDGVELPFDASEHVDVTTLATREGPYSTTVHFQIASPNLAWRGYLKVADDKLLAHEFEALRAMSRLMDGKHFSVARPIAYLEQHSALVTEAAPGVDLGSAIKERVRAFPRPRAIDELLRHCERCGEWLRVYHEATCVDGIKLSLEEMRDYVDARLEFLARQRVASFSADDRRLLLQAFDRLAEHVSDDQLGFVGIHGDYSPGNLIVSEKKVVVIDFTMAEQGSRYHDIAHLYHHLRSIGENPRYDADATRELRRALARGFGDPDLAQQPLFRLFELQHAVCMMAPKPGGSMAARLLELYLVRRRLRWLRGAYRSGEAAPSTVA